MPRSTADCWRHTSGSTGRWSCSLAMSAASPGGLLRVHTTMRQGNCGCHAARPSDAAPKQLSTKVADKTVTRRLADAALYGNGSIGACPV